MIFTRERPTLTVTLVKSINLAPVASKTFIPKPDWQDITASFPDVPAGTYRPLFRYMGFEWLGENRTIKTTRTINVYTTVRGV